MPQKLQCTVAGVIDHGERVYSVFLKPDHPSPRFLAGQFLHLALDPYTPGDFWPESRVFSIASPPKDRHLLRITYAVKGQFTTRMETELCVGREVWIKLPYGEFIVSSGSQVCLLAGGTGITAFTAFLAGLPADHPHPVYLFYGARCPDLLIYRPLVEAAIQSCSSLHAIYFTEHDGSGVNCLPGRIDLDRVWSSITPSKVTDFYLSGPPEMIHTFTHDLSQRGVNANQIHADAWE